MDAEREPRESCPKVPCPNCGTWASAVVEGRPSPHGYRRRRVCAQCGARYVTLERALAIPIKKSQDHNI